MYSSVPSTIQTVVIVLLGLMVPPVGIDVEQTNPDHSISATELLVISHDVHKSGLRGVDVDEGVGVFVGV